MPVSTNEFNFVQQLTVEDKDAASKRRYLCCMWAWTPSFFLYAKGIPVADFPYSFHFVMRVQLP
ncbi:hypothetical protein [Fischerella thermalis]|uniref:hypothetical protein n=1 Tax=Fischerella thermalis TaxID=372787 RepID=UPI0011AFB8ED|nr:hypothetical protein [Fischerella thermalis]